MFTQAGIDRRARPICVAKVVHERARWRTARVSYLHRWRKHGDLAWVGGGGVSWGEQLHIQSFFRLDHRVFEPWWAWRCDLVTRREEGDPWP